jgi:hypothetical protein
LATPGRAKIAPPPVSVDEAIGMLDEDGLVALVQRSLHGLGLESWWLPRYTAFTDAATRAGYRLGKSTGRKVGLDELVGFHGFEAMLAAARDCRLDDKARAGCSQWVERLPGFVRGGSYREQPQTTRDQHGTCEMIVRRRLVFLLSGNRSDVSAMIVNGNVAWPAVWPTGSARR